MAQDNQGAPLLGLADIDRAADQLRSFIASKGLDALEDHGELEHLNIPTGMKDLLEKYAGIRGSTGEGAVVPLARSVDGHTGVVELNNAALALGAQGEGAERWDAVCLAATLFQALGVDSVTVRRWLASFSLTQEEERSLGASLRTASQGTMEVRATEFYNAADWRKRDFTLARLCYLAPAARSLAANGRAEILDIFQRRSENMRTLVLAAMFCVAVGAFAIIYGFTQGVAPGVLCLLCALVCLAIMALGFMRFLRKPFNGLSGLIPVLFAVWLVCAAVAVAARWL